MTNLVQFPKLGLSFNISNVAFSIFGIDIYWYGVVIGLGMLLAVLFAFRQATRFGIDTDRMIDVIFMGFIFAIVFGRLYYVIFVDTRYRTFGELINLRNGGIAIYGGIIGAFLGAALGCKLRRVPMLPMFDVTSMGFLIGQSLGRWGNFFNQEAFGTNTDSLFGMISPATTNYLLYRQQWLAEIGITVDPAMPVHPTFLYESIWCAIGFLILWRYSPHRRFNGEIVLFYVMWYGTGRFFIEGLRTDPLMLPNLGMPVSQVLALTSAVAAFVVWAIARRKTAGKPLAVPAIPPHTAVVKLDGEDVTISWPANGPAPGKEQRQELARTVLKAAREEAAAEKEAAEESEPGTKADDAKPSGDTPDDVPNDADETETPEPASTAQAAEDTEDEDDTL